MLVEVTQPRRFPVQKNSNKNEAIKYAPFTGYLFYIKMESFYLKMKPFYAYLCVVYRREVKGDNPECKNG
jgi:hypothetical protein